MMNILLTGASSFTGLWFTEALAARGHKVTVLLRRSAEDYQGIRQLRVKLLANYADIIFNSPFGSDRFLEILESRGPLDLFCHHAAEVSDYKNPDFDFAAALASNTKGVKSLFEILLAQNCRKFLLTGSVFEQREGFSSNGTNAISAYGLSKGLTSDVFRYFAGLYGLKLGKFVIPNPFGPYEEDRFTSYLAKCWLQGKNAIVSFPDYIRDNIPVTLLSKSYAAFAEELTPDSGYRTFSPSFFPAPQSCFVQQFAQEMQKRFDMPCAFTLQQQVEFPEPKVRINCDPLNPLALKWDESVAWDALANFYLQIFQ